MFGKDFPSDVMNLEIPTAVPKVKELYQHQEILIIKKDGSVRVVNSRGIDSTYDSLSAFQKAVGLNGEEFNLMYYEDDDLEKVIKENLDDVLAVKIGDM